MRNPRWTWTAALAAMGLAASSPWIDAQTTRGLVPEPKPGDAAGVQIAPANPAAGQSRKASAGPAMDPGEAAMLRSRSARTVMRNGLDYIKYQQYERALAYLREAERRKQELNSQELISLRQGIDAAQEGLRAPSNAATYAKARKPQAGSIAIAARSAQKAPLDTAMQPASNEVPLTQPVAPQAVKAKDKLAELEPIAPEVLAKTLPSAADLARSKSIASARQQYAAVGNGGDSQPLPPLSAPKATSAEEPAAEEPAAKLTKADSLPPLSPTTSPASSSEPAPLPGSPTARASVAEAAPPALDKEVAAAQESLSPPATAHEPAPALPKLSVPTAPPEEPVAPAVKVVAETPPVTAAEPADKPAAPVVESPALPPLEPADKPAELKPSAEVVAEPASTALPELPTAAAEIKVESASKAVKETAEVVAEVEAPKLPAEPKALPMLESAEPQLPPLPAGDSRPVAAAELEVKPAKAEVAAEEPAPPAAKPVQEVGGIPVLTPLADDDEPAPKLSAKPLTAEEPGLPPLPETPAVAKPEAEASLPPLPTAPAVKEEAPAVKAEAPVVKAEAPAAEPVKLAEKPAAEPALPTLPVAPPGEEPAAAPEPAPAAREEAKPAAEPGLPPLPVAPAAAAASTDTPPVPTAPVGEPAPERVALKEAAAPAASADSLPPLPAEEVAPAVAGSAAAPRTGDSVELGKISEKFLGGLTAERRREIEQMARNQVGGNGATPGLSPLGNQPPEEAGALGRQAVPGSNTSISATDDPLVRLELPRAPSPAEARPIRAILLPEQFDNIKNRQFNPRRKMWASAATAHYPLYFQDPSLERYGISIEQRMGTAGRKLTYPIDDPKQSKLRNQIASPFFSSGLFAVQIMTWPFRAIADPPWESEYDLGYYRPGDKVPEDTVIVPWKGVGPLFKGNRY